MIRAVLAACALLTLAHPANAQDDDALRLALARETLELTGAQDMANQMSDMMMPTLAPALRQQYPNATSDQINEALAVIGEAMRSTGPEMVEATAALYAERFTASELEAINAFYQTDAGRKTITLLPELMQQGAMIGQQLSVRAMTEIQPQIDAIMTQ